MYKSKTTANKLLLYLPFEVIEALGIKDGDEMDFFKFSDKAFLFAKKSDITSMLAGKQEARQEPRSVEPRPAAPASMSLPADELAVLKKLDTLRYGQRTPENVAKLLNDSEKSTLQRLLKEKAVTLFKNPKEQKPLYGISKAIYDKFLMRKKVAEQQERVQAPRPVQQAPTFAKRPMAQQPAGIENENVKSLETNGFVVIQTESEASAVSLALEDSIRHGMVLGTRAFNKKFYIVLRSFINENSPKILKAVRVGPSKVSDIAKEAKIDEDAVRAILYLLAESGEVSERRKDVFAVA